MHALFRSDGAIPERWGSTSFLARRGVPVAIGGRAVKLNVARRRPLDAAIPAAVAAIERRRSDEEKRGMEQALRAPWRTFCPGPCGLRGRVQAAADMAGVTRTVLDAVRTEMGALNRASGDGATTGFLAASQRSAPPQAVGRAHCPVCPVAKRARSCKGGVRVVAAADPYPTVAALAKVGAAAAHPRALARICSRQWKSGETWRSSWISNACRDPLLNSARRPCAAPQSGGAAHGAGDAPESSAGGERRILGNGSCACEGLGRPVILAPPAQLCGAERRATRPRWTWCGTLSVRTHACLTSRA